MSRIWSLYEHPGRERPKPHSRCNIKGACQVATLLFRARREGNKRVWQAYYQDRKYHTVQKGPNVISRYVIWFVKGTWKYLEYK